MAQEAADINVNVITGNGKVVKAVEAVSGEAALVLRFSERGYPEDFVDQASFDVLKTGRISDDTAALGQQIREALLQKEQTQRKLAKLKERNIPEKGFWGGIGTGRRDERIRKYVKSILG